MALVAYESSDDDDLRAEPEDAQPAFVETSAEHHTLFDSLPAPRTASDDQFPDEPELIVKPSEKELALRVAPSTQSSAACQPPSQKKKKIIPLPSLPTEDSDDDDDDDDDKTSKNFRPTLSKGSFDLFGSLPKPKHASVKEVGRALVPHTLTKRQEPQKQSSVKPAGTGPKMVSAGGTSAQKSDSLVSSDGPAASTKGLLEADYTSEGEEDEATEVTDFFSISASSSRHGNTPSLANINPAPNFNSAGKPSEESDLLYPETISAAPASSASSDGPPYDLRIAPTEPADMQPVLDDPCNTGESGYTAWSDNDMMTYSEAPETDPVPDHAAQIQAPFGRKRKRGHEQDIPVIEVNLADHMSSYSLEHIKNLTVEHQMKSHSKKNNKDMPTSQQKRKHQITYLAHQAKERELELKNQWAENKYSKKQTQSKYGF